MSPTGEEVMCTNTVVSRDDWVKSRKELLLLEKKFMANRDALSKARRELPWVKVEQNYFFEDSEGRHSLSDLFGKESQLIVQHFMFGEDWDEGCPSCSLWADSFDGAIEHLGARDAGFVVVSSAQSSKIAAYKKRMGWKFRWLSCQGSGFNEDYHVSFSATEVESGNIYYNYRNSSFAARELPGISVFIKDASGQVFHTYSSYSRGLDNLNVTYQLLDLLPKGRDEDDLGYTMEWVRRRDKYGAVIE